MTTQEHIYIKMHELSRIIYYVRDVGVVFLLKKICLNHTEDYSLIANAALIAASLSSYVIF